jgi:translation elongation factor P/translation initiation factor 5A
MHDDGICKVTDMHEVTHDRGGDGRVRAQAAGVEPGDRSTTARKQDEERTGAACRQ